MRLIKHNFPFIPPHCGVYIAQSRGTFPDPPAQTLFDLLKHRDFALSPPIGIASKDALPPNRETFARLRHAPWGLYRKKEEQRPVFLPQEKDTRLLWTSVFWVSPFVSCPAPRAANPSIIILFSRGLLFEKESPKSYSEGLRGGFFCRFEVYRTAIIYYNNLCIRILQIAHKTDHVTPKKKNSTSLKSGKWSINQEVRRIIRPFPS